jgi:FG-GAP-like repeat/ASPIC and UnbV
LGSRQPSASSPARRGSALGVGSRTRVRRRGRTQLELLAAISFLVVAIALLGAGFRAYRRSARAPQAENAQTAVSIPASADGKTHRFMPRLRMVDVTGFGGVTGTLAPWGPDATLAEISRLARGAGQRAIEASDRSLADPNISEESRITVMITKVVQLNSEGDAEQGYKVLEELRSIVDADQKLGPLMIGTVIYLQGTTALRRGETDNCVMCRGESSCILPLSPAAVHTKPTGSRLAIKHFSEYLAEYPDDIEIRWLLNLAHMTLGEYPAKVEPRYRLDLDRFFHSELDIGKFRDIGHLVGVNRYNQAGGAIMEDFDNDGLLDLIVTSFEATVPMAYYHNQGNGTFKDRSAAAGLTDQLGGLVCYQGDYDNDGLMDVCIVRGAWLQAPIRPSLLHNDGAGHFTDVTQRAGLLTAVNSNAAAWADYDNDGWLDLFITCERQPSRLYHNKGDGTFEEVAAQACVQGDPGAFCKGCAWIDFDNDDYPDLFVNYLRGTGHLYHNNRDGQFIDETSLRNIDGPECGFSCWAWDYDNDGWLDIFATCFEQKFAEVIKGMLGEKLGWSSNRLFRNLGGHGFEDKTEDAGLNHLYMTMGSNFADFDNDGWLDMYLATGEPNLATLVPNRMFKNVDGRRFADITASSGTGHLQKGHAVACGDWDRDGDVDLFVETGGAVDGDRYHNVLFQNPGQKNHWLTLKLVGKKTNRAAIGARIKVVTAGARPLTIHRHVSSGSSFGANTLQQTIGLAQADRVARLEIHWPTSGTTQVFTNIGADQAIEVAELAGSYRPLDWKPLPQP